LSLDQPPVTAAGRDGRLKGAEQLELISSDPLVMHGQAVIAGTGSRSVLSSTAWLPG
jgi:hypothetical protein